MISFEFDRRAFKTIMKRFLVFGIPIIVLSYIGSDLLYNKKLTDLKSQVEKQQEELVLLYEYQFRTLFSNIYDDLNIVKYSDEFQNYLNQSDNITINEARQMFFRVLTSKKSMFQLRFLSLEGKEVIRIERNDRGIHISEDEDLQNKKDRYYFSSLEKTKSGDLYVSDFDLNIEYGEVQYPYIPTIRFGIPIFYNEEKKGYLIVNIDGLYIIDIFTNFEKNKTTDLNLGLLDQNNLINLNVLDNPETLESSFIRTRNGINPLYDLIQEEQDKGRFVYQRENYYYNQISGDSANFDTVFDELSGKWVILSSYDEKKIISDYGDFYTQHEYISIFVTLLVAILVLIAIILITEQETEHLLLLATGIISDFSHDGVLITNSNKKVIYCNPNFENMFGYKLKEIKGKNPNLFLKGEVSLIFNKKEKEEVVWEGNIWDVTSNHVHIQRHLRIRTVSSSTNQIAYYIGIYSEPRNIQVIDEKDTAKNSNPLLNSETISFLAPKLQFLEDENTSKKIMIALRIKELSLLKNSLTEDEENNLIGNLSLKLKDILDTDSIIIAPSSHLLFIALPLFEDSIEVLMGRIDRAMSSMQFADTNCVVEYVSGISLSPDHGNTVKELIEKANIALEALSRVKKTKYLLYNHDIFEEVNQYHRIKNEFNNAFKNDEFTVVYQPQNNAHTKQIVGMEALVRWNNESLGHIPPYLFIPIMEEDSDQIKRLGKHILEKVINECRELLTLVSDDFKISINLSSQEFSDSSLIIDLIGLINKSDFPAKNICFEITETVLSEDLSLTNNIIDTLHHNNITVAIDDFGTGYSSLGYIKKLNSDKLKVDREFIKDYPAGDDGSIIKAIIKLANELNMKVIVEGVETEVQLEFIRELGSQEYQGYLCSKPVSIDEIKKLLQ
jgi:EAL domain-containing protein (putative c-di-GMP-specific phosphodiesterase class I)/PAS domain-containing protein